MNQSLQKALKNFTITKYQKGSIINVKSTYIYLLLGGIIQYTKFLDEVKICSKNLIFDYSLFGNFEENTTKQLSCHHCKCLTNVEVITIASYEFCNIVREKPEYFYPFFQMLNQRLIDAEKFFTIVSHKEIVSRLAHFLLLLASYYGNSLEVGIIVNVEISQEIIANILNTTRVTINRLIGKFKKENIIQTQGRKIIILKPIALNNFLNLT